MFETYAYTQLFAATPEIGSNITECVCKQLRIASLISLGRRKTQTKHTMNRLHDKVLQ